MAITCPKCGGTNMQYWNNKKGPSAGKGCCGFIIFGPLGLLCSLIGNDEQEYWVCNDCGEKFDPNSLGTMARELSEKYKNKKKQKQQEDAKNVEIRKKNAKAVLNQYKNMESIQKRILELQSDIQDKKNGIKAISQGIIEDYPRLKIKLFLKYVCIVLCGLFMLCGILVVLGLGSLLGVILLFIGFAIAIVGQSVFYTGEKKLDPERVDNRNLLEAKLGSLKAELDNLQSALNDINKFGIK